MSGERARKTVMLLAGLLLTIAFAFYIHRNDVERIKQEFATKCNDIRIRVLTRLESHEQLLHAASAYFEASDDVTSEEWKDFVENSEILQELPGIQGIGYAEIVSENNDPAGKETSIILIEPSDLNNQRVLGYDMFSDPVRKEAMELARDSDFAVLSGKVKLLRETDDPKTGTLMFVPVFKKGQHESNAVSRRSAISGWVYSPYRMDDLIHGALGNSLDQNLSLRIYADSVSAGNLLFENNDKSAWHSGMQLSGFVPVNFNGTLWILEVTGKYSFFSSWSRSISAFSVGIILILLLFHLYTLLIKTRIKAQNITGELTRDLIESEEKYRLIAENISDLIWILDLKTMKFSYVSPSVKRLTGFTEEEAMNLELDKLIGVDDSGDVKKRFTDRITEFLADPGIRKYYYDEFLHTVKTGDVWIEVMTHYQYSKKGEIELFGIARNISERKKDEQQLKESERKLRKLNATKDRLFSIIAHDLRTPFSSILGFTSIIAECCRNNDTEKAIKLTDRVNSAAGQTLMLLENLLEWARSQTGEIEFRPEPCLLYPLVHRITGVLKTSAEIKQIIVEIVIEPEGLMVLADVNMLEFILRNLLSNAVKFTHTGGKIFVRVSREYGRVKISVEDNGIGINEELKRKLIDSDDQISESGTSNEKGSGLGMLLCKDFLKKHGSALSIESSPGKGSCFSFVLNETNGVFRNLKSIQL